MANSQARIRCVEEHVGCENRHDLDGIMGSFGDVARYEDEPWHEEHDGRDAVRRYYETVLSALPDLRIDVARRFVSDDGIVLEVTITGTHLGAWRGLPPTGRRVELPLCAVFGFDDDDRMTGERIYYDRATLLRQLGVFREPDSTGGRVELTLMHPLTLLRAFGRSLGLSDGRRSP